MSGACVAGSRQMVLCPLMWFGWVSEKWVAHRLAWAAVLAAFALAASGCSSGPTTPASPMGPHNGPGALSPGPLPPDCTARVGDAAGLRRALGVAQPGDSVCVQGDLGPTRLAVQRSGTPDRPIQILGDGSTVVAGITINADYVVVRGFKVLRAHAPGVWMKGTGITLEDNLVRHPTGDDSDGIRFFGRNLQILHNTITDISPDDSDAHADCIQSFATGPTSTTPNTGASRHVLIDGNRCQHIDNQCLIVEGPFSSAGDGSRAGLTSDIRFTNNYCEGHAAQGIWLDDVRDPVIENNQFVGLMIKAIGMVNNSIGGRVGGNIVAPTLDNEISMDTSSALGYQGPPPDGSP